RGSEGTGGASVSPFGEGFRVEAAGGGRRLPRGDTQLAVGHASCVSPRRPAPSPPLRGRGEDTAPHPPLRMAFRTVRTRSTCSGGWKSSGCRAVCASGGRPRSFSRWSSQTPFCPSLGRGALYHMTSLLAGK